MLFRADSGFDSAKLMCAIGQQARRWGVVAFIIKWNPRTTPVETVAKAKWPMQHCVGHVARGQAPVPVG